MQPEKFLVGRRVRLRLARYVTDSRADVYEVSRILPSQEYRVKRVSDGQERAVSEDELIRIDPQEPPARPEIGAQQEQQRNRNARASARSQALARRHERKVQ